MKCPKCGSERGRTYTTRPPCPRAKKGKGPKHKCGPECDVHGWLCLNCRLFTGRQG